MTRSEAIDTAVRRHWRGKTPAWGIAWGKDNPVPLVSSLDISAIRRHFQVICRQYGVTEGRALL